MPRIAIDARMANHGGIGTYIRHLLPALASARGLEHCCVVGAPFQATPVAHPDFCSQPYSVPIYSVREQLSRFPNPHGARLWHSPHFNIPLRWRSPLVVTIHDLIHVKFPQFARTPLAFPYAAYMLRQVARRAGAVIVNSETTKRDFCHWTHINPQRVSVIPWGVAPEFSKPLAQETVTQQLQRYGVRQPFILWISAIRPHKNPLTALRAFARLRIFYRLPHQLVMIGQLPQWYQAPTREAQKLGLGESVKWLEAVPYGALPAFYQGAELLVMPSYYEGFGFPALEAMASGLPVFASTTPALSELVDSAGVTINPDDVDGWAEHLYNALRNDDSRRTLRERGRLRAKQFTWERAAARHIDIYRSVGE